MPPHPERGLAPFEKRAMKRGVLVTGVWVRTLDRSPDDETNGIEVLVEVAGKWRLIQSHGPHDLDGVISHITEPLGIKKAPLDTLGD